jgi:hypothetical protein
MSGGTEASWYAATTVFKGAPVMTAKITVIDYRRAARNISVAAVEHAAAAPSGAPGAKSPAVAAKDANSDTHAESESDADGDADRVDRRKARIGSKQPAPDEPGVVIRNEDDGRIHRRNGDDAGFSRRHDHLRR